MAYDVGDVVTLSWAYGLATTAAVTVTLPDGTTSTPSVTGTTSFTASFTTTLAGYHRVRWVGTGSNPGAYEDAFNVELSTVEPILGLADAKAFLRISTTDHDDELRLFLDAVSDKCEEWTRKVWRRQTFTEVHSACDADYLYLRRTPVISVTSVTVNGTAVTDYTVDKRAGLLRPGTSTSSYDWPDSFAGIGVVYVAGPSDGVIPARILQGCRDLLRHWWNTQRGGSNLPRQSGSMDDYDPAQGWYVPNRVREAWGEPRVLVR